jgi:hypothetical protein
MVRPRKNPQQQPPPRKNNSAPAANAVPKPLEQQQLPPPPPAVAPAVIVDNNIYPVREFGMVAVCAQYPVFRIEKKNGLFNVEVYDQNTHLGTAIRCEQLQYARQALWACMDIVNGLKGADDASNVWGEFFAREDEARHANIELIESTKRVVAEAARTEPLVVLNGVMACPRRSVTSADIFQKGPTQMLGVHLSDGKSFIIDQGQTSSGDDTERLKKTLARCVSVVNRATDIALAYEATTQTQLPKKAVPAAAAAAATTDATTATTKVRVKAQKVIKRKVARTATAAASAREKRLAKNAAEGNTVEGDKPLTEAEIDADNFEEIDVYVTDDEAEAKLVAQEKADAAAAAAKAPPVSVEPEDSDTEAENLTTSTHLSDGTLAPNPAHLAQELQLEKFVRRELPDEGKATVEDADDDYDSDADHDDKVKPISMLANKPASQNGAGDTLKSLNILETKSEPAAPRKMVGKVRDDGGFEFSTESVKE